MGSGSRPRSRYSLPDRASSRETSESLAESIGGIVFSERSSNRTMQRCVPSIVQSERPDVPSAHPSQTPRFRILQANGICPRFSHAIRAISRKCLGPVSSSPKGERDTQ